MHRLGDLGDEIEHVRHAAGAFVALVQRAIDGCRHDDGPRIFGQQVANDLPDLAIGDGVALTDEHWSKAIGCVGGINASQKLIVNVTDQSRPVALPLQGAGPPLWVSRSAAPMAAEAASRWAEEKNSRWRM